MTSIMFNYILIYTDFKFLKGGLLFFIKWGGRGMKKRFGLKVFIYFLCGSFLLMMNGFPRMVAEAKENVLPIGEMVSKGEVKFEARQNIWKGVESSHFPIFQGTRIKTEKGIAVVTLSNNSQIEVSANSLFSLDQNDRFVLSQGSIEFRIPSASEINFKVGNLSILKSRTLQAAKDLSVAPAGTEETIGSISIHTNGSVTIKSTQGKLTIMNQDQGVLAALSSKDSVTMPSITVGGKQPVMVAQVGETGSGAGTEIGGIPETYFWVGLGLLGLGGSIWAIHEVTKDHGDEEPVCP
jgi:hypothetical protein